ncbi:MAG: circularly permuted type 2 ATP-grasp protein [Actinomycetota bacterium]|nr:circularly permuted type 2 ATP-grasp protein [Actinomycetota bacterium]
MTSPFDLYRGSAGAFDEFIVNSNAKDENWLGLAKSIENLGLIELKRRAIEVEQTQAARGITFTVGGQERTFPLDPLPRIISYEEWSMVELGLMQRIAALEAFLDDIYGSQEIVRDKVIPKRLISNATQFSRAASFPLKEYQMRITVAGLDLIRDETGELVVLEDNLRTPSGVSYVIENRRAMARILPELFENYEIEPVTDYPSRLLASLISQAPTQVSDPLVVVLTPGIYNSAYFEHAFLARQMGVPLVEPRDLFAKGNEIFVRTTKASRRVDVIYRRIDDEYIDPLFFKPDSYLGIPGLLNAIRAGGVTIANAIGNGVADDKLTYAYLNEIVDYYLHQKPLLKNIETYRLEDPDVRKFVIDNVENLVVKPVDASGGKGIVIGSKATEREIEEVRIAIIANPRGYIAQRIVNFSTIPTVVGSTIEPRHADLRPFIVSSPDGRYVVPGGLSRVALNSGSMIVNSSQGGGSKDTWIIKGRSRPRISIAPTFSERREQPIGLATKESAQ